MSRIMESRRKFLKDAAISGGGLILAQRETLLSAAGIAPGYKIHIRASVVEIAPKRSISTVTYNGQFPGPPLRFKEGEPVTVAIFNDTETPEQLHWHGQKVGTEVDGAAEEGTPFIPRINGDAYPMMQGAIPSAFHVKQGKRYRIRIRNSSDDIHPIHLHRHSFELTKIAGKVTSGIFKDVVMLGISGSGSGFRYR